MTPWHRRPISQLFSWARWLRLRHTGLRLTKLYLPATGVVAAAIVLSIAPGWNVAREFGVVHQVNGLLQILAAFFIAALALIASFPGDALDRPMGATAPVLPVPGDGDHTPTRREFFGMMFAYLSAACVLLYVLGSMGMSMVNPGPSPIALWLQAVWGGWPLLLLKAAYIGAVVHVLSTTLLSLHFLGGFLSSSVTPRAPSQGGPQAPNGDAGVVRPLKRKA